MLILAVLCLYPFNSPSPSFSAASELAIDFDAGILLVHDQKLYHSLRKEGYVAQHSGKGRDDGVGFSFMFKFDCHPSKLPLGICDEILKRSFNDSKDVTGVSPLRKDVIVEVPDLKFPKVTRWTVEEETALHEAYEEHGEDYASIKARFPILKHRTDGALEHRLRSFGSMFRAYSPLRVKGCNCKKGCLKKYCECFLRGDKVSFSGEK
jgi:hypothetical protein